jgi:cyanophycinase
MTIAKRLVGLLLAGGLAIIAVLALLTGLTHARQVTANTVAVPIGGGYQSSTYELFAQQAIAHDTDGIVTIRVLPITYADDPYTMTQEVRQEYLALAADHANEAYDACVPLVISPTTCVTSVVDIMIRSDAEDLVRVGQLTDTVDGVFIPGGDQTIAMQVVGNTPAEAALEALYGNGVPIGGTSAGAAVLSRYMIGGFTDDYDVWNGLEWGAVDLWYGPTDSITRGLRFGTEAAVFDQHFLERGRLLRLLQAVQRKPGTKIGVGVDWGTGLLVEDNHVLTGTAGWYAAVVLDEQTYNAAETSRYLGPKQILSIHNVAMHILPPGDYSYDLNTQHPIISGTIVITAPNIISRNLSLLQSPSGAGALFLTGDLWDNPTGTVSSRFADLARTQVSSTVVLAAGFITESQAVETANAWAADLGELGVSNIQTAVLTATSDLNALAAQLGTAGAIFVTGNDQVTMASQVSQLQTVGLDQLWRAGRLLLLDNAAAAAAGSWMSAEPTPTDDTREYQSEDSFLADYVTISPGLGLISGAAFEPRVSYDFLYGRLVSHLYQHPGVVAFGIQNDTAIEVTPFVVTVVGQNAVIVIDGRYADQLGVGTNDAFAATGLLLDTFAPGETLTSRYNHWVYLPLVMRGY